MGKTYKRNQQFRPKKHGKVFSKDQPWKKDKNNNGEGKDLRHKYQTPDYDLGTE